MGTSKPTMVYSGNIEDFAAFWSYFITCVGGRNIKDKSLKPEDGGEINLWAFLIFGTLSNCPGKEVKNEDWLIAEVMDKHDTDRPDEKLSDIMREALDDLENEIYVGKSTVQVLKFNRRVMSEIQPFFYGNPEFKQIDPNDPYGVIRFLQQLHAKAWKYDNSRQSDHLTSVMDWSRSWKGGNNTQFIAHIAGLKDKIQALPARIKAMHHMSVTINSVIGSLAHDGRLKALHTFLRTQYDENPDKINLDYIVDKVTAELRDLDKGSEVPREEEPVASLVSCNFVKSNKRKFQPQESRSPKKGRSTIDVLKLNSPWFEPDMFNGMSSPIRNGFLENKRSNKLLKAEIRRLRRAQGRGAKSQQQLVRSNEKSCGSKAEADLAEARNGDPLSCLIAEVDDEILNTSSEMTSEDGAESTIEEPEEPKALFTSTAPAETTTAKEKAIPSTESSPTGSMSPDSGPAVSQPVTWTGLFEQIGKVFLTLFLLLCAFAEYAKGFMSYLWGESKRRIGFTSDYFYPSGTKQAAKSAAHCSMTQYQLAAYIVIWTLTCVFLWMSIRYVSGGSMAQAASMRHLNESKSILSGKHISPFMSYHAAESMLAYKGGNWLFSFEISELEAHAVTLPSADRDMEMDWILNSGASCHFCNDSSKFISMRKCNVSISTAKKGENLLAIGVGDCLITTQSADGEQVKLICRDTLDVPEARRNLLSASKLAKDNFQVVLPAQNPVHAPGIYNCRKGKTTTAHSIPIIAVGTLFHIQTCADNVIRRSERIENKWICWHRRLGYMPLETLKNMVGSCQGLDDLQGVAMPRNYVSANVRMGKATNLDQPQQNPIRAFWNIIQLSGQGGEK